MYFFLRKISAFLNFYAICVGSVRLEIRWSKHRYKRAIWRNISQNPRRPLPPLVR